MKPADLAASTILIMPRTGLTSPSRETSPTKSLFSTSVGSNCFERTRTARAIGRSRCEPSLTSSAGARLMVTFLSGKDRSELVMAERTRSRASVIVLLAMPTILKAGRLLAILPSTVTM